METTTSVCSNPWCKGHFTYTENDFINKQPPTQCRKCMSFSSELSGGVEWVDKTYVDEETHNNNSYQEIKYKVNYYNK